MQLLTLFSIVRRTHFTEFKINEKAIERAIVVLLFSIFLIQQLPAQSQSDSITPKTLFSKIAALDSALFTAFNTCNLATFKELINEDFEFYDDRTGLNSSVEKEFDSFRNRCNGDIKVRRELVKSTLQIYPLEHYGAVQMGDHRFYETEKGRPERLVGTARFVHVWQYKNDGWKLSRVISYEHKPIK